MTVCLSEESARKFPSERKQRKPRRRGRYQIGREVVEEESFSLLQGFNLRKEDGYRARKDGTSSYIIPAVDGIAVLSCLALPQEWNWRPWHTSPPLDDNTHSEIQVLYKYHPWSMSSRVCVAYSGFFIRWWMIHESLTTKYELGVFFLVIRYRTAINDYSMHTASLQILAETYDITTDESMPFDEKIEFFSNVSSECSDFVKDFQGSLRELQDQQKATSLEAVRDTEFLFTHISTDVEVVLLHELSLVMSKIWPALGAGIFPDVPQEGLQQAHKHLRDKGINAWELLDKVQNQYSYYDRRLSMEERVMLCVVVFVDLKADTVSRDRVWGFLTWGRWKIDGDLRDGHTLALWSKRSKLRPSTVFSRIQTVMRNNLCPEILAGEEGTAVGLASELPK